MRSALAILAKAPRRGQVKTRLCPPLTLEQATELYRAFLLDTVQIISEIEGVDPGVLFTPDEAFGDFHALMPPHFFLVPQVGDGFGERMANGFRMLFGRGYEAVAIMDADSPTLPRAYVRNMFDQLRQPHCDLSVGPCEDGGYWAIGMKQIHLSVLTGISWSTPYVLGETLQHASEAGLPIECAPCWHDVDDGASLRRLLAEVDASPARPPRHTRQTLREIMLTGPLAPDMPRPARVLGAPNGH